MLLARYDASPTDSHYYHHDGLGSIMGLTNENGSVEQSYSCDEFGISLGSWGSVSNHYLYTGQEYDADVSGAEQYNLRARYCKTGIGRFTSEDPIKLAALNPQDFNPYAYTNNNPMNYVDIVGLTKWCYIMSYYADKYWHTKKDIGERWLIKGAFLTGLGTKSLGYTLHCVFEVLTEGTIKRFKHTSIKWWCIEDTPCGGRKTYTETTPGEISETEDIYKKETRTYPFGMGINKPVFPEDKCWQMVGRTPGWQE